MKRYGLYFLAVCCLGCSEPKPILKLDTSYRTGSYQERISFIVLHYTAEDNEASLRELTQGRVSTHYLIMQGDYPIYQLVDDDKVAWHAGQSSFRGKSNLNDTSIGIEIVNEGIAHRYRDYKGYHPYAHFVAYDEQQIKQVGHLLQQLSKKYTINPRHIVAHSDIAPNRKGDPGAKFPWKRLHDDYGVGAWYDENDKRLFMQMGFDGANITEIKRQLRLYGYTINDSPTWDKDSQNVVYAFQLHFNPNKATGEMDLESYAILRALNKKYVLKE